MIEPIGYDQFYAADPNYDRIPEYDPRSGDHYWIQLVAFKVNPSTWHEKKLVYLDKENLVQISGVGCYYCELQWARELVHRRCPGPPPE